MRVERLNLTVLSNDYISLPYPFRASEGFEVETLKPDAVVGDGFPPAPRFSLSVDIAEPNCTDIRIRWECGRQTVAVVTFPGPEFVESPSGLRRFAAKAVAFLQRGVSLVVIDAVTVPAADFHAPICDLLGLPSEVRWESPTGLSAICYRTVEEAIKPGLAIGDGNTRLEMWPHVLTVGAELPTVPVWLEAGLAVPLDLESTISPRADPFALIEIVLRVFSPKGWESSARGNAPGKACPRLSA